MKKILILLFMAIAIFGCGVPTKDKLFILDAQGILDTENVTVSWLAIDDRSLVLNYTLFNDGEIISQGLMQNNTREYVDIVLDITKQTREIKVIIFDEAGNWGEAYAFVNLSDRQAPHIILLEIVSR